jgi:hypothetical protein
MARSKIRNQDVQLQEDSGAVLWSFLEGEQNEYQVTLNFLTNLDGYVLEAVVVEALNTGNGKVPGSVRPGGDTASLAIITTAGSNVIKIRFPGSLIDTWEVKPTPDKAVYGFFDLSVGEPIASEFQKIYKPMSGLVEVGYSPTHHVA